MQATILQAQVKAQAERDVAAAEAEWRKLTDIIDTDRAARVGAGVEIGVLGTQHCA